MKRTIASVVAIFLGSMLMFTSCNKDDSMKISDEELYTNIEEDLKFAGDGDFEKIVTNPLIKRDDCKYIVAGTIQFIQGDKILAVIDFGDGACDNIATKTVDDVTTEFSLDKLGDDKKDYKKVVVEPIVKLDDCAYIVSGIVKFYKGDAWVATIDYGDGTCDEWATKTWDGGSKVFSMAKD